MIFIYVNKLNYVKIENSLVHYLLLIIIITIYTGRGYLTFNSSCSPFFMFKAKYE